MRQRRSVRLRSSRLFMARLPWWARFPFSMRIAALISIALLASLTHGECLSIEQTKDKTGARVCVSAKVLKVVAGRGAHFLDFCEDYTRCPFTVVVFDRDLRDVGDIRQLEGKLIE